MQSSSEEARWISEHLKELARKPVLSELSMGILREKYFFEVYSEFSDQSETSFDFDEFKLSKTYKRSSVRIAKHLQGNPHILIRGEKRGKTYRHKESRPIFDDRMIAEIIPAILRSLQDQISWSQLYYPIIKWAQLLHESYETHPSFLDDLYNRDLLKKTSRQVFAIDMETMSPILIDGLKTLQLALEIPLEESRKYRKTFPSDLKKWVHDAYSNQWWEKSSSNIQSIMKKEGKAGPGSKRGTWLYIQGHDSMKFIEVREHKLLDTDARRSRRQDSQLGKVSDSRMHTSKQINTNINKLEDRISELFRQLESERHLVPVSQYSETVISEIRKLQDISEHLLLVQNRISRFTDQLKRYEELAQQESRINPETD